ncbi:hypothetical protein [Paenibacillus paridis]|uniref:hypothetical protein n=1 Tax=Paenibacillus paridis TaxID=2583376 RepID=UPI0011229823|nr:hypothetical protein [Paenibacillus paridis]
MINEHDQHKQKPNSLATEKDIDPAFGLFTEEVPEGAVSEASELLLKQYPKENGHVHEPHVPYPLDARNEVDTPEEISEELAAVPDADLISKDSPVDPASPGEEFHGTDLLNGVGRHPEEETEDL